MSVLLRINDRDLSAFVVVGHEDGLDPAASGYLEPQFAGSTAFSEGMRGIGVSADNREVSIPLMLAADSSDALHTLIRDINNELVRGAQVEWSGDDATQSTTFFDLEGGRLEVNYQFWLGRSNRTRAMLRLWTQPYGHTGTVRLLASRGSTGPQQLAATGVLGDAPALGQIEVRVGSRVASNGRMIAYGVHRSASFSGIRGPSGPDFVAQSGATVRGGSGAIGSQFLAVPVSPTVASGVALTSFLDPPGGHVGRHRVLGIMRSRLDRPITVSANDRFGAPLGPTAVASPGVGWGVVDLGEISVPERRSTQESVPTQYVEIRGGGASGNQIIASPALEINRLVYLPIDDSPGVLRTRGAAGNSLIAYEDFTPLGGVNGVVLRAKSPAYGNYLWNRIEGEIGLLALGLGYAGATGIVLATPAANASGFYSLASGVGLSDTLTEAKVVLNATYGAPSSAIEIYAKQRSPSTGFGLRLEAGPSQALKLISYTAAGASVMASAGIATTLASGLYQAQMHKLILSANGGELAGYIGTAPVAPAITASHADVSAPGWPALRLQQGSNPASGMLVIDALTVYNLGAGASDMSPREWFRFEATPERRAFQGNASVFLSSREAVFRGVHPRVPAVGSPGASGPAQIVVLSGDPVDFLGNDRMDVSIQVKERFRFLR